MRVRPAACVVSLLIVLVAIPASDDAWAQRTRADMRDARDYPRRSAGEAPRRSAGETPRHAQPQSHGRGRGPSHGEREVLSDAVRRVERRTGGQVLSAEVVPYDGRDISRIKVVDSSGRVRVYLDDPVSSHGPRRIRRDDN